MQDLLAKYGDTALITGASSGIGKAYAQYLAQCGFNLVLVARRLKLLDELKNTLETNHPIIVHIFEHDLSQCGSAQQVCDTLQKENITVSLLINNAGFGSHGELDSLDIENEMKMVDVNCRSVVEYTHTFLPEMKRKKHGAILFTASVLSVFPGPFMATYCATKTFDYAFAKSLYGECKPHGIDVLAVLPGYTATNFFNAGKIQRAGNFPSSTPEQVVHTSFRALGKKPFVVDGWKNKLGVFFSRFMPARLMIHISTKALR